jgi:hypothetical protein
MGTWNYRFCRRKNENSEEYLYGIHEAYCNSDGSIWAITENAVSPFFSEYEVDDEAALNSMAKTLEWMKLALTKPMIDLDTFVYTKQEK